MSGGPDATQGSHLDLSTYNHAAALDYDANHKASLRTRLTTWRERTLLRRALGRCGTLHSILDIPCGSGRFFPVIARAAGARLIGSDNSDGMLAIAAQSHAVRTARIGLMKMSLFNMELGDASVDCVVCLRFLHHIALPEERMLALRELHRVTRRFVVLSLWVDGNLQARRREEPRHAVKGYQRRGWVRREVIARELADSGFRVLHHCDVAPGVSMWRFYLLEKTDATIHP